MVQRISHSLTILVTLFGIWTQYFVFGGEFNYDDYILNIPFDQPDHYFCLKESCLFIDLAYVREVDSANDVVSSIEIPTTGYNFSIEDRSTKFGFQKAFPCVIFNVTLSNGASFETEDCLFPSQQSFTFADHLITVPSHFAKQSISIHNWPFNNIQNTFEVVLTMNYTESLFGNQTIDTDNGATRKTTLFGNLTTVTISRGEVGVVDGSGKILPVSKLLKDPLEDNIVTLILKSFSFNNSLELDPQYGIELSPNSPSDSLTEDSPSSKGVNAAWLAILIIVIIALIVTVTTICIKYKTYEVFKKQ